MQGFDQAAHVDAAVGSRQRYGEIEKAVDLTLDAFISLPTIYLNGVVNSADADLVESNATGVDCGLWV